MNSRLSSVFVNSAVCACVCMDVKPYTLAGVHFILHLHFHLPHVLSAFVCAWGVRVGVSFLCTLSSCGFSNLLWLHTYN